MVEALGASTINSRYVPFSDYRLPQTINQLMYNCCIYSYLGDSAKFKLIRICTKAG